MGFEFINEEQKVRINLSRAALSVIRTDMQTFSVSKIGSFLNIVFSNYRENAGMSIDLRLKSKKDELEKVFEKYSSTEMCSQDIQRSMIDVLVKSDEARLIEKMNEYRCRKEHSFLLHINNDNMQYLLHDCEEDKYYKRPGEYLKCVIEEYCALPFLERERIYKKDVFEVIQNACDNHNVLKIHAMVKRKMETFKVYPYRIVSDQLTSRSYLICYSKKDGQPEDKKEVAPFTMSRLALPRTMSEKFKFTNEEISALNEKILSGPPAFMRSYTDTIIVSFTKKGKSLYHSRVLARPMLDEERSTENEYVFNCSVQQAYEYFYPFGPEVKVLSPQSLVKRFQGVLTNTLKLYI